MVLVYDHGNWDMVKFYCAGFLLITIHPTLSRLVTSNKWKNIDMYREIKSGKH